MRLKASLLMDMRLLKTLSWGQPSKARSELLGGQMARSGSIGLRIASGAAIAALFTAPSNAHNEIVHQDIVDYAFETLLLLTPAPGQQGAARELPPPRSADPATWARFIAIARGAPSRLGALDSGLSKLNFDKSMGVRPLDADLAPGSAAGTPLKCVKSVYGEESIPDEWWKGRMREVHYPVALDFAAVFGCGARSDWTPGAAFDGRNGAAAIGADKVDHTGLILGLYSADIDLGIEDTHLWYRPTAVGGLGALQSFVDDAVDTGLAALALPLVCLADCIFGDCSACDDDARDLADAANPMDDVGGLVPGLGDISTADYVGVWHHINMNPGASNEYDDRQGLLFEDAGPDMVPSAEDLALMAYFDAIGLSVNYEKSRGVHRYQIDGAADGAADTEFRGESQWQFRTLGHTAFEPVDNLAFYGWRLFRDGDSANGVPLHRAEYMGFPLHAIGDATSPMHVIASSTWGHRPFEDAVEALWPKVTYHDGPDDQANAMAYRVLTKAYSWWLFIETWRSQTGRTGDVPVRELVTRVAQKTYDYSMEQHGAIGWPFLPLASAAYFVDATKGTSIATYVEFPGAVDLVRPLIEESIAATIAFLVAASENLPSNP